MSRFMGKSAARLKPYAPGEQPQDKRYIKLNTNECPYPPSPEVEKAIRECDPSSLRLYPDPEAGLLREAMARFSGLDAAQVFAGGGSDEILGYFFMAFFDRGDKVYFPDITYGFYPVYARLCGLQAAELPLREDFTVGVEDYLGLDGHIVLANPNAPTGICLEPAQIERILLHNPDRLVLVDEAYVDFAPGKSCVPLVSKYDNLLVVQTFSKSRSLAGMRVGFGFGSRELIAALNRVKYSFNPYNISRLSMLAGIAAIEDESYFRATVEKVRATRDRSAKALSEMGFRVLPSESNFLFACTDRMDGLTLYTRLKERGILVRHFAKPPLGGFVRISVGADGEMNELLKALGEVLKAL